MSRIEQIIGDIEEFIDGCKYQPLSNTKILVNKDEIEELLVELRLRVPEEIKRYQKIISQQEAILADAQNKADSMLNDAKQQTEEMVAENEVMQLAYQQANELVEKAQAQAEQIIAKAYEDAAAMRASAVQYTDSMLAGFQNVLLNAITEEQGRFQSLQDSMQNTLSVIQNNRRELSNSSLNAEA